MAIRPTPKTRMRPRKSRIPRAYLKLMERFLLRPIHTDDELTHAIAVVDELSSQPKLLAEEEQYLDVLCELIRVYEAKAVPMAPVAPRDLLHHLIEARGVSQQAVAAQTGIAGSTISALVSGKRPLTRGHIERFARYFGVEPGVFLPD